jgi:lysophospholipase L1-like esterase
MKRLAWLVVLLWPAALPAQERDLKRFEKSIEKFEKQDGTKPFPPGNIVFTGSSSIALWTDVGKYFPEQTILNRGFGGSTIPEVNYYLERAVLKHRPRLVVLFCGGNDMASGRKPEQVLADFQTFCRRIHEALPETRIVYLSIHWPPGRPTQGESIRTANRLIADACSKDPKATFVNIHDLMLGPDGKPNAELYRDPLHPNAQAYALWAEKLRPVLGR